MCKIERGSKYRKKYKKMDCFRKYSIDFFKIEKTKNRSSLGSCCEWGKSVTYIRVTRNSNKIPILNSNNIVVYLTQVNEGNSISFIYTIGFYRCFGIHSVISLLFT